MTLTQAFSVVAVSAAPIAELRGGLPLALSFGLHPAAAFFLAVSANLIPVLPLLFGLGWAEGWIRRSDALGRCLDWVFARTRRKGRVITRYGAIGLVLLVAVPLPGTGAWTGAIAAFLFGIPVKRAFPLIVTGVYIAGTVVLLAGLGVLHAFDLGP